MYASVIAPSVISADSPRFLGFIPAAPTKASLLFDMLVSCASIQGISWLEASGAIAAENTVLRADRRRGRPAGHGRRLLRVRRFGRQPVGPRRGPRDRQEGSEPTEAVPVGCGSWSAPDAHSSIVNTLRLLEMDALVVDDARPPADRRDACGLRSGRAGDLSDIAAVVCTSGTTNAGIIDDLAGVGALARGARLVVPRRRRLRRVGHLRPLVASRSTTASSRPTRSSSTRTSGCSRRSTAARCCTASPSWRGPTHTQDASYLDVIHVSDGEWNPTDYAYHLTRRARGLPLWFSLAVYGVDAYREAIEVAAVAGPRDRRADQGGTAPGADPRARPRRGAVPPARLEARGLRRVGARGCTTTRSRSSRRASGRARRSAGSRSCTRHQPGPGARGPGPDRVKLRWPTCCRCSRPAARSTTTGRSSSDGCRADDAGHRVRHAGPRRRRAGAAGPGPRVRRRARCRAGRTPAWCSRPRPSRARPSSG